MSSFEALAICAAISVALSFLLTFAIVSPLRAFIQRACPQPEAVSFWSRFTLVMLFLGPLFCCLVWGLPSGELLKRIDLGLLRQRAITSSIVGAFLVMVGIGFWVSAMSGRQPPAPPPPRKPLTDDERVF